MGFRFRSPSRAHIPIRDLGFRVEGFRGAPAWDLSGTYTIWGSEFRGFSGSETELLQVICKEFGFRVSRFRVHGFQCF